MFDLAGSERRVRVDSDGERSAEKLAHGSCWEMVQLPDLEGAKELYGVLDGLLKARGLVWLEPNFDAGPGLPTFGLDMVGQAPGERVGDVVVVLGGSVPGVSIVDDELAAEVLPRASTLFAKHQVASSHPGLGQTFGWILEHQQILDGGLDVEGDVEPGQAQGPGHGVLDEHLADGCGESEPAAHAGDVEADLVSMATSAVVAYREGAKVKATSFQLDVPTGSSGRPLSSERHEVGLRALDEDRMGLAPLVQ
jgi:hypothetical protein